MPKGRILEFFLTAHLKNSLYKIKKIFRKKIMYNFD